MNKNQERGIAIVMALILMSAMSVLAASLMFLAQTETYASMNYRMMSQARYAGEAAVQKASDFLLDAVQYSVPTDANATDPLGNFDRTRSPVRCAGGGCTVGDPIVLSATAAVTSNYPAASVQTDFNLAAQGSLPAGTLTTVNYGAYATLIAMQEFKAIGGTQNVVQTWEITGIGSLAGSRPATVEVVAVVETPKVPANNYAAFATADNCGAMSFAGNTTTDSYDSTSLAGMGSTAPTTDQDGGDVGTNGNMNISGSVDVYGNLYTPRAGVGDCAEGAVTALTAEGMAEVNGSVVQLPTVVTYPAPIIPAVSTLADVSLSSADATTCLDKFGLTALNCNVVGDDIIIQGVDSVTGGPLSLPSISLTANSVRLVLVATTSPAQYNFNSISLAGGAEIEVRAANPTEAVLVNVVGKNPDGTPIDVPINFVGGTFAAVDGCATCSDFDASMLQFVYGGTGEIKMAGHAGAAASIYAPEAAFTLEGTADLYGSVLARTITVAGNADIHYDRRLARDFYVMGRPMVGTFSWKRY
jgi:Tfp pilus assembly protein PilX